MKVVLTLSHENQLYLREFVTELTTEADSALQAVSDNSYATCNTLRAKKDLLTSASISGEYMRMELEGRRQAVREASASIAAAADRKRIRCWRIEERARRDIKDRTIERAGGY